MNRYLLILGALLMLGGCAETITSSLQAGMDVAVIAELRTLHTMQTQFMMKNQRYGTFAELRDAGMIDEALASGEKHEYVITLVSADEKSYVVRANPDPENRLCTRHFYLDQTGLVRAAENRPARSNDPPAVM